MQREMIRVRSAARWKRRPIASAAQDRKVQLRWGLAAAAITGIALLMLAYIFVSPPGTREYTAEFREAQAVQTGVDVRIAGISVGKISDVQIGFDHIDVKFRVDKEVFVGDASTIEMKMLTTVGGYYLALLPLGDRPLTRPIGADRVTMPYSLMETFQQATPKVKKLEVHSARTSLAQLNDALTTQPDSIRESVSTLNRMLDNALRQQTQIGDFVRVMNEYATVANANGEILLEALRKLGVFFASANQNLRGHQLFLEQIAEIIRRVRPALALYLNDIDPMTARIDSLLARARQAVLDFDPMMKAATELAERVKRSLTRDGALALDSGGAPILASDLCFPTPEVKC